MAEVKDKLKLCPLCGKNTYTPYGEDYVKGHPFPALSRRDNKTYICSPCGEREGLEDWQFGDAKFIYHAFEGISQDKADVVMVVEGEDGPRHTDLNWGCYELARKACARVNKLMGYSESAATEVVCESMRRARNLS